MNPAQKARQLLADAVKVMSALHDSMRPDDTDESAIVPADALRRFVDAHATLLYESHQLPVRVVEPGNVAGDFMGVRIDASKELPDADTTVIVWLRNNAEPVWLGYHDGERWLDVTGMPIEVICWTDMLEPVEELA